MMRLIIIFVLLFTLNSCSQLVDFELPFDTSLVILNGIISPKEKIKVSIRYSKSASDTIYSPITNLNIRLFENSVFVETLKYTGNSFYEADYIPGEKNVYRIEFEYNDQLIWAEDTIPANVNITSVYVYEPVVGISYASSTYIIPVTLYTEHGQNVYFKLFNATTMVYDINFDYEYSDTIESQISDIDYLRSGYELTDFMFPENTGGINCLLQGDNISIGDQFSFSAKGYLTVYSKNYKEFRDYIYSEHNQYFWMDIGTISEPLYGFSSNVHGGGYGTFFAINGDSIDFKYVR